MTICRIKRMLEWILTIAMVLSMLPTAAVAQVEKPETMIYGRQKLPDLEPGYLINPLHDEGAGPPDWFCSQFYPPIAPVPLADTDEYGDLEDAAAQLRAGMSNVLLEAAAIGRPVITSNIHGCREAVAPEMSGLLCDARNQDSLYDQMLRMLCFSRDKRREMGLLAREYITEKFDKQNVVAMTVDAIESAMHTSLIKGK